MSVAPTIEKTIDESDMEKIGGSKAPSSKSLSDEEASPAEQVSPAGGRSIHGIKWALVCISLYISAFLYGLDTTIAADVQGPVIERFGQPDKLSWIGTGFPLGSVAVILLLGNMYGNFNMKWLFVGSILLFEVGSTICGAAPTMDALIVGRVLAGAGGSGMYLGVLNYLSLLTSEKERGLYITATGLFWGVGAVLGPVIGGAFASSSATWRWAFYINLVIGAAAAPVYVLAMPTIHPAPGKSLRERIVHFDFLGLFLIAGTWGFFTVAFQLAGTTSATMSWAWSSGPTIALLVLFGVFLVAAVVQQYFTIFTTASTRAFPGHLLLSRTQVLLFCATAASTASLFVPTYYIPIFFQFVKSDTPIRAAVRLLPFIVVAVFTNLAAGALLSKIRYYMPVYLLGGTLVTIGGALLMTHLDVDASEGAIYGFTVIIALGTGLTIQLGYAVATLTVSPADIGHALSMQNVSQIGSTVICLVIAGQVFQSAAVANLGQALAGKGFSAQEIAAAVTGAQSEVFQQLSGDLRIAAIEAIVQAMQKSFILVIVGGAVLFVSALLMKREKLFGDVVVSGA
ncbi:major facilitator superfamily domain-containing protein [Apodospora peruviana]|uniref:Major facilitator superfamily domain-containing protein n=1 Tax=Apodospora peruviana TaxID=516989 RepID=A0AAE0HUL8_9PEZI|nr:major facilitator superfamily domain-containing protein [Apodospora peruviana]